MNEEVGTNSTILTPPQLTSFQLQVLVGLTSSKTMKELAAERGCSIKTVEWQRAQIYKKLGLHDIAAITRYAIKNGFIRV